MKPRGETTASAGDERRLEHLVNRAVAGAAKDALGYDLISRIYADECRIWTPGHAIAVESRRQAEYILRS